MKFSLTVKPDVADEYVELAKSIEYYRNLLNKMELEEEEPEDYSEVYEVFMEKRESLKLLIKEKL